MNLLKFRIFNYKSIKDTGICWLSPNLTLLAGKNESGKTAILEALNYFNTDIEDIPGDAFPLDEDEDPYIELYFEVDGNFFNEVEKKLGMILSQKIKDYILKNNLMISKASEEYYWIDKELENLFDKKIEENNKKHKSSIQLIIDKIKQQDQFSNISGPKLNYGIVKIQNELDEFIKQAKDILPIISNTPSKQEVINLIEFLTKETKALKHYPSIDFVEEVKKKLPNFIYFTELVRKRSICLNYLL